MQKNSSGDETKGYDDDYIGFHSEQASDDEETSLDDESFNCHDDAASYSDSSDDFVTAPKKRKDFREVIHQKRKQGNKNKRSKKDDHGKTPIQSTPLLIREPATVCVEQQDHGNVAADNGITIMPQIETKAPCSTSKMKRKSDAPDSDAVGSKKHKHASIAENSTGLVADDNAHVMPDAVTGEIKEDVPVSDHSIGPAAVDAAQVQISATEVANITSQDT
jgi:hypothetical protein